MYLVTLSWYTHQSNYFQYKSRWASVSANTTQNMKLCLFSSPMRNGLLWLSTCETYPVYAAVVTKKHDALAISCVRIRSHLQWIHSALHSSTAWQIMLVKIIWSMCEHKKLHLTNPIMLLVSWHFSCHVTKNLKNHPLLSPPFLVEVMQLWSFCNVQDTAVTFFSYDGRVHCHICVTSHDSVYQKIQISWLSTLDVSIQCYFIVIV